MSQHADNVDGRSPVNASAGNPTRCVAPDVGATGVARSVDELLRLRHLGHAPGHIAATPSTSTQGDDRYRITDFIAQGGMGAVLEAQDANCQRSVAMKVMLKKQQKDQAKVVRFIEEAQITGQLEHPNIVPVHELGVDASDNVFFTMKLIRGKTLKDILTLIRDGDRTAITRYSLTRLLTGFLRVCDAVAFGHSRSVVHRDLKPANIMVGKYGEVMVMDWGLAKILGRDDERDGESGVQSLRADNTDEDMLKTMDGQILGTPQFMAPEQALGRIDAIDERTDIYSLGAILYNILALRPPISDPDVYTLLHKVAKGDIVPPAALNAPEESARPERVRSRRRRVRKLSDLAAEAATSHKDAVAHADSRKQTFPHCPGDRIPTGLSAICMKALAVAPDERYADVKELQGDIEAWLGGFATSVERPGMAKQLALLAGRHRAESAILVATLFVMLCVGGVFLGKVARAKTLARHKEESARAAFLELTQARDRTVDMKASTARIRFQRARRMLRIGHWKQAGDEINESLALDANGAVPAARHLAARVALGDLKFSEAQRLFGEVQELDPHGFGRVAFGYTVLVGQYRDIAAGQDGKLRPDQILRFADKLRQMNDHVVAMRLFARLKDSCRSVGPRLEAVEGMLEIANPRQEDVRLVFDEEDGVLKVDLSGNRRLSDIRPLAGLPVHDLNLAKTVVSDLRPLRGMPLERLNITQTLVQDLTPVKDLPLHWLCAHGCPIKDPGPIAAMKVTELILGNTQISDLSFLEGKQLTHIGLAWTPIRDISVLRGMPLKLAVFAGCENLHDLSPLDGCETLELVSLPLKHGPIDFFRDITTLKRIGYGWFGRPSEEFWKQYDAGMLTLEKRQQRQNRTARPDMKAGP